MFSFAIKVFHEIHHILITFLAEGKRPYTPPSILEAGFWAELVLFRRRGYLWLAHNPSLGPEQVSLPSINLVETSCRGRSVDKWNRADEL